MTINGTSPNFRIKIRRADNSETDYLFEGKYREMRFYSEDFYKTPQGGRARSGRALQKFKWILNYYEIDFTEFISDDDAYKVRDILNSEAAGDKILITPSDSIIGRYEEVVQLVDDAGSKGKKQLTPRFRASWNKGSKGLLITYVSAEPLSYFNWENPANAQQVYLTNFHKQ